MKILIIGSGGREHALAWAFKQNPKCRELYCIPGNAGIAKIATCKNIDILDNNAILEFCKANKVSFVMIGPEGPLEQGLVDLLIENEILVVGPKKKAAMLESSKSFTKMICGQRNIPTAKYRVAHSESEALDYLSEFRHPYVIKEDGLAAGKGVLIAKNKREANEAVRNIFQRSKSDTKSVIIEEFLKGEEVSVFILTDGVNAIWLGSAQDYKKAFDNDLGPNTGGMGAYSPALNLSPTIEKKILDRIIYPTLDEMKSNGTPFCGILYAGLMIIKNEPHLIEYNVRLGDPECQVLAVRLGAQLLDVLLSCAKQELLSTKISYTEDTGITVVVASKGYPGEYQAGSKIFGLESIDRNENIQVFHSGTISDGKQLLSHGGRVLSVTARDDSLKRARNKVYNALKKIIFEDSFYRSDIGYKPSKNKT